MEQRINAVTNPEGKAADLLNAVKAALGATPNLFTAFANAPTAMEGYLNLNGALQGGTLTPQYKEKLALTVAGLNGCDYCASAHTFLGEKAGIDAEELSLNLQGKSKHPMCQAGLDFVTKVVNARGQVSAQDLQNVRDAGFSDERIIEMITHIALNTLTNYFNEVFQIEVDFPLVSTRHTQKAA
ncbi:MAG: peroxidase [Micavibrio sp.]|nr:peroxidase [Micavibrio sp.]|tara:strand:- start:602 stop:1153 length:552 start_codon:yes stop_codon:yes gene_type:complete